MAAAIAAPVESHERAVCATVAYDGTDYHGFQAQPNAASIQQALEEGLDCFVERSSRVIGAGRTDAGVHASGQVVAVHVKWRHSLTSLQRAWNVHLPAAIIVSSVQDAPAEFHPRFSAVSRTYRYTVWCGGQQGGKATVARSPLTDRFAWFEARPLDVVAMNLVSASLVGRHDFATFGQPPQGENTVRTVEQAWWAWVEETATLQGFSGQRLIFTITADAFLRQMVRSLVGALLAVGRSEWTPERFATAWAAADRSRAVKPAAPQGLVLEKVTYPAYLDRLVFGKE